MGHQLINCQRKHKALQERYDKLRAQQAQEILDLAAQHPVICETVIIDNLKVLLRSLGEEVKPHDTLHHKIENIITAKNKFREMNRDLMSSPASDMLKKAMRVIRNYVHDIPGKETAAALFMKHPIVKALEKEMKGENAIP